jgi:hypothetical protein
LTGDGALDLGHGHTLTWVDMSASGSDPAVPEYGAVVHHPGADGSTCTDRFIVFAPHPEASTQYPPEFPTWNMESREPLTLSPSLLCRVCGDHGFIRDGHWVPA